VGIAVAILPLVVLAACGEAVHPVAETTTQAPSVSLTTTPPTTGPTPTTMPIKVSGFLAQSASFVSAAAGFVLGVVGCPLGTCLALRRTVDRGAVWTTLPPPPSPLGGFDTGAGVSELHFADALDGWAFGGSLWATHDGAQHWHVVDLGGPVVAVASGAGVTDALVEGCVPSSSCTAPGHLYRSPVGQDSWAEVAGVSVERLDQVSFSLVAEGQAVFVLDAYPSPEILRSSDGVHFVPLTAPCSPEINHSYPFLPYDLAASDPSDVAVACLGGAAAGSEDKQVYISHDGGDTYKRLPDPPAGGDGAELAMPSPNTLLLGAASAATWVYRVAPPDTSWATPLFLDGGGIALSDLAFVDPSHGALVFGAATVALSILGLANPPSGLGTLYLTDDSGAHWRLVHIPA
jgi:hypothetical protein